MKKALANLFVVLLVLTGATTVNAQSALASLEDGGVYRFVNRSTGRALNAGENTTDGVLYVNATTAATDDLKQQWYVTKDGDYYVLRNLYYARFLKGAVTNKVPWSLTEFPSESSNLFSLATSATNYNSLETKDWTNYGFMHDDGNSYNGGYRVVSWENGDGNTSSHWTITKVEYTAEELKEVFEEHPTVGEELAERTANFVSLFNEAACYTPKYATLADAQATDAYLALDTELRELADKIYNKTYGGDGWAEANADADKEGWEEKYAKKFRVQMYEPYSIAGDITGFLRMNAHSNNDNPTGIYVAEAGTVYVIVEGEVKEGASLRLVRAGSNFRITNATAEGYALTTGLNIVNITDVTEGGDHLYICYNVDTYNPNGKTVEEKFPHKLSDYEPLTIHIEGGYINGFYNACGDFRASAPGAEDDLWCQFSGASYDCDADWEYMEERANLAVLPIVSNRQVMLFQLEDTNGSSGTKTLLPESVTVPTVPNYYTAGTPTWDDYGMGCNPETGKINIWMETWDRIMYAELATLGLIQKSEIDKMNQFYPRWNANGTRGEIYNYDAGIDGVTYQDFCRGLDYSEYYNHHGVSLGAESGFMSAGWHAANYNINTLSSLVTMAGSNTDGVNNYAVDIWGPAHEIGHQFQDVFNIRGGTEVTNNVFSNAAVWYQGAQTSRYNWGGLDSALSSFNSGTPFIDYNIWAMTQMFYKLWLYYHLAGNNTQFYPRFFEMLRVDPLNATGGTATGTESMLKIYEKMCDAAGEDLTEFFRAHGFFVLLDNYAKGDYGTTIFTQTQEEVDAAIERVKAKYDKENYAVLLINDLTTEILCHDGVNKRKRFDGTPASEYGTVDKFINGTATDGGEYTASVNSDGTITMSGDGDGIGFLILDENGELVSFSYNSTFELSDEAMETIMTGNATLISVGTDVDAEPVAVAVDLSVIQKDILGTLIAKAQLIIDKVDDTYTKIGYYKKAAVANLSSALTYAKEVYASSSGYEGAYDLLYDEYQKVLANGDAKIPFDSSLTYIITNKAYTAQTMWVNDSKTVRSEGGVDTTVDAAKWQFKETGTSGVYNIYNMSGYYCPAVATSTAMTATSTAAADALYTLLEMEDGVWAIKLSPSADYRNFHSSGSNVVGWETGNDASRWYLTAVTADPVIADLTNLEVSVNKTEALLDEVLGSFTYTTGTAVELQTTTQGNAYYLWSNAPEDSEGSIDYLVDGITGDKNNYFHTEWSSEPASGTHYIAVDLGAGNALDRFTFSCTTRSDVSVDFPKSVDVYGSDDDVTYKYLGSASGMPQAAGTSWQFDGIMVSPHRYLRFNMHASRGYWHMAEFDVIPVTGFTATVNDTYSNDVAAATVEAAMEALLDAKSVVNSSAPTNETIDPVLTALETAYENLYKEYEATINARKNTLAGLVTETNNLIKQVGTVDFAEVTPLALNASNLYCNAPYIATQNADYSADYATNLTDGDPGTYLHTRWNANSDDGDYHYLRVDVGESTPVDLFSFTYTTVSRSKKDMPLTMVVEGANSVDGDNATQDAFTEIATLTSLPEVLNTNTVYKSAVLGTAGTSYRYLRFKVTDITADESDGNGHPFFTMAEFGLSTVKEEIVTIYDTYKSNVNNDLFLTSVHVTNSSDAVSKNSLVTSVPLLDAQIADQQAAKDNLYEAMNDISGLKASLQELIDKTQALYDKMVVDGNVAEYYKTSALTAENITAAQTEIADAQAVVDADGGTTDDIATASKELTAVYDILVAIENDEHSDKAALETLISDVEALLAQVSDCVNAQTDIALQTTASSENFYLWSNATASDCGGIGALVDEKDDGAANTGTFFGTVWQGGAVENYSHYIEVDLGENVAIDEFAFDYTTRNSTHENQRPDAIKILCSNDKVNYDEITTISEGLATAANEQWAMSEPLSLGKCYRYIRFAVASDVGYFNMSDFNITATRVCTIKDGCASANLTKELLLAAYGQNEESADVVSHYATEENYSNSLDELQAVHDALVLALAVKDLPVQLTTDAKNPVLYKIKINRSSTTVLEYDGKTSSASKKVAVSDACPTRYQAWYFMEGTDEESYDDIQILPYYNEGADNTTLKLGTNAISGGSGKVVAVDGSDSSYKTNWYITFKTETTTDESGNEVTTNVTADGWWNIQPEGKGNYFSNYGGVAEKMGFYNSANDDGSEFQFVLDDTDYSFSEAYYTLYNKHMSCGGERTGGVLIGQCTQQSADAYNSVYGQAKTMLENRNSTDAEYIAMYENLVSVYDALAYNMPVEGGFYVLRSAHAGGYAENGIVYVGDDNGLYFSTTYDTASSRAIWQFESVDGGYNLKNLHTGDYIKAFAWGAKTFLNSTAGVVKLEFLDTAAGILKIVSGHPMHAQSDGSVIVGYSGELNSASAWYVDELSDSDVENIHYPYTLSALGYGTLMLGFDAKIPEGVKAHYAESLSGVNINMVSIDDVIPANTAVILKSDAELDATLDIDFKYSTTAGTPVSGNMLAGTLYKRAVKCDSDDTNNNVYVMQAKNGVVKMYWAYENYDATGQKVADDNGSYENDLGGYIMCSANRAYLVVEQTEAAQASMFNLRFGGLATAVDEVESADVPVSIYDLQGRKLKEITTPGLYIVNGKKIFVK